MEPLAMLPPPLFNDEALSDGWPQTGEQNKSKTMSDE
jgi:hypothetical protein